MDVVWILLAIAVVLAACALLVVAVQRRRRSGSVLAVDLSGPDRERRR